MLIKMLIFDFRKAEYNFFKKNSFDNFDIHFFEESLNETTVNNLPEQILEETAVISITRASNINEEVLKKLQNLKIISTRSTGYDHINIEDCKKRNINVLNVQHYGNKSIAEYTFGLIINLLRKIIIAQKDMRNFKFEYKNYVGTELHNLTLGVFGTGAIGSEICRIAHAFNMKIMGFDKNINTELVEKYGVKYTDKETILRKADIITLHLPLTDETDNFITKKELAIIKDTAYIVNTAAGKLINIADLYDSITNENLAGAALDVLECESIAFSNRNITSKLNQSNPNCIEKVIIARQLSQFENVIITPHIAYSTTKSIDKILEITFDSIQKCIQGGYENQVN